MKKRTSSAFAEAINLLSISKFMQKTTYQRDISSIKDIILKDPFQRTDKEILTVYEFIYSFNYVQKLKSKYNEQFVKEICRYIYYKQITQNTIINTHKNISLVLSGRVLVTFYEESEDDQNSQRKEFQQEMTFGGTFNEFGLSENRKCYAKTIRPTELACIDVKIFNEVSSNQKSTETFEKQLFIKTLSFCQIFSDLEIKYLSYHLEQEIVQKNTFLYQEKDENINFFYFIARGEVEIFKTDSQGKQIHLTKLIDGEFFGEEGFFQAPTRQFASRCTLNQTKLYRVQFSELDKRLWRKEQRKMFYDLIGQKWIYRYQRFCDLSETTFDKEVVQEQIKKLNNKLNPHQECKIDFKYLEKNNEEQEIQIVDDLYISASWLLKSAKQAQSVLQSFEVQPKSNDKIKKITQTSKFTLQLQKIKDQQKKQSAFTSRGNKLKVSNSQRQSSVHEQGKVASNMNYLKHYITDTEKYPLEQQLKQFLNKIEVNDKNIYWGDDGTAQDRDNRINKFYHTMSNYAKFQYFKNKNLQESKSQKAKQLDEEYQLLVQQQEANLKKTFEQQTKSKTDNMLRKEFFLNHLKKMQKRLKVLELIQKGKLQCNADQYVNEDGDIVDIDDDDQPDDAYDVVNGKKVRKFNFVTSECYDQYEKHKIRDFKTQIDQQKQKIIVIEDIVKGKLPVQAAAEAEINLSSSVKKLDQNRLRPPSTKISQFITEQRRQSSSFRSDTLKAQAQSFIKYKSQQQK